MKVQQLEPKISRRVQFSFKDRKLVPRTAGCYALTNFEGDVLYVGLSDDLYRRFAQHRDTDEKRTATAHGKAFWFYYLTCSSKDINRIERAWLNQHISVHGTFPILNKVSSPIR